MSKILVIGIIGQSVFMKCNEFPESGETIKINDIYTEVGGKGFNQALTAKNLGADVKFVCALGDDLYGQLCISEMNRLGVKHHAFIKKNQRTAYANILTNSAGANQVCVYQGANFELFDLDYIYKFIDDSEYILLQLEIPNKINKAIVEYAFKKGKHVILNPAPAGNIDDLLPYVEIITPNEIEVEKIFGDKYREKLLNRNFLSIITRGEKNTLLVKECIKEFKVNSQIPVDTTGAGDAFNGALVYCLSVGISIHEAIKFANEVAGITIKHRYVLPGIEVLKN